MTSRLLNIFLSFVVMAQLVGVKPVFAQTLRDRVTDIEFPFDIVFEKTGPVRLSALLYEAKNRSLADYVKIGDRLKLEIIEEKPDRYGRKSALVYLADDKWLQGELVKNAQAIPYPYPGEEHVIRDLYELETPSALEALAPTTIKKDTLSIVEGVIIATAQVNTNIYLNFGNNWRDDFTVRVDQKNLPLFYRRGIDPMALKGKTIRIRGWVLDQNGPMINATTPYQIEIINR